MASSSQNTRVLSQEEEEMLERQNSRVVPEFKQQKLEKEAMKNWDVFYKRNTTKFFKDRHWTTREFKDLCSQDDDCAGPQRVLEVGCGVGNFIFPLMEEVPDIFFYACDFSSRAVQFVKDDPRYHGDRCYAFQCDLTRDDLTQNVAQQSIDIVTMIFVLSAIHPEKMISALRNIFQVLRPGGSILIRDYGLYDHAMLRFGPGNKLAENFYVRQDGTRAYYFSKEKLMEIFSSAGFVTSSSEYILRETVNKKESLCVPRVFVQGKFTVPLSPTSPHCSPCEDEDTPSTNDVTTTTHNTDREPTS